MNKALEKYLVDKFPDFFVDYGKPATESCMHWGCTHGDGWFLLLLNLCNSIEDYINRHNLYVSMYENDENKAKEEGKEPQARPEWAREKLVFKFEQIKEKFGSLRIYYTSKDKYIVGLIGFAESLSRSICEFCGKFDTTIGTTTKGWIQSVCQECASKDTRIMNDKKWQIFEECEEIQKILEKTKKNETVNS